MKSLIYRFFVFWRSLPQQVREKIVERIKFSAFKVKEKLLAWVKARREKKNDPFIY